MKRIFTTVLAFAMVTSMLTGCGTKATSTSPPATSSASQSVTQPATSVPDSTGKLEFANDKLLRTDLAIIEGFAASAKKVTGIEVMVNTSPDTAAYQTTIQQSIRDKSAPGMFTWWSGDQLTKLAKNDLVEDLTTVWKEYITPAGVSKDIADAFTVDGKIVAVPYSILYNTILYNSDAFKKAGVEEPKTFDEFLAACEKLKAAGITPIAFKNDGWAGFIWFQQMLATYDPQLYVDLCTGAKKYTDPDVVTVMNTWKEMIDKGYFSKPISIDDVKKKVSVGEIAMMLEPTTEIISMVTDYGMKSGENLNSFVLPSSTGKKGVVFFEAAPICVSKASADKGSAVKALETWYNPEHQSYIADNLGIVNTSKVEIKDPIFKEIIGYTAEADKYQLLLRYYENTSEDVRNVALDELMKFELGDTTVDAALNTIQAKADEIFGK